VSTGITGEGKNGRNRTGEREKARMPNRRKGERELTWIPKRPGPERPMLGTSAKARAKNTLLVGFRDPRLLPSPFLL
jgi:hypothetical protein